MSILRNISNRTSPDRRIAWFHGVWSLAGTIITIISRPNVKQKFYKYRHRAFVWNSNINYFRHTYVCIGDWARYVWENTSENPYSNLYDIQININKFLEQEIPYLYTVDGIHSKLHVNGSYYIASVHFKIEYILSQFKREFSGNQQLFIGHAAWYLSAKKKNRTRKPFNTFRPYSTHFLCIIYRVLITNVGRVNKIRSLVRRIDRTSFILPITQRLRVYCFIFRVTKLLPITNGAFNKQKTFCIIQ